MKLKIQESLHKAIHLHDTHNMHFDNPRQKSSKLLVLCFQLSDAENQKKNKTIFSIAKFVAQAQAQRQPRQTDRQSCRKCKAKHQLKQATCQPSSQDANQPTSQPTKQPANQAASKHTIQATRQPGKQRQRENQTTSQTGTQRQTCTLHWLFASNASTAKNRSKSRKGRKPNHACHNANMT